MTHSGGCQCGAVRFTAEVDLSKPVIECNCSYCSKNGLLLTFVPKDALMIESGEGGLVEYRFNTHKIVHQFCGACGVQAFAWASAPDGTPMAAINARCIDGVDLGALTRHPFDGASR